MGVAGQVVGVVGQEGAMGAAEHLGGALSPPGSARRRRAAGRAGPLFGQQVHRAATAHLKEEEEAVSSSSA